MKAAGIATEAVLRAGRRLLLEGAMSSAFPRRPARRHLFVQPDGRVALWTSASPAAWTSRVASPSPPRYRGTMNDVRGQVER